MLGPWDPREIYAVELDAAIWQDAKQACVACGIPNLHFVKSIKNNLDGWKRKDKYEFMK